MDPGLTRHVSDSYWSRTRVGFVLIICRERELRIASAVGLIQRINLHVSS